MPELFTALLALLIALMGLAMILGFPLRSVLRTVGKRGVILLATSLLVFQAPALLEHLQRNPPRSVRELAVWCGVAFTLFLILLRMARNSLSARFLDTL